MSNTLLIILLCSGIAIFLICLNELRTYKRDQEEANKIIANAYDKFWGDKNGHS